MGTGKIFGDSANIYQDQARVLFDYYKKAAEKIVASENEVQQKIQDLTDHKNEMEKKIGSYKILYIVGFVLAGAGLILGLFYPALLIAVIAGAIIGIKYLLDYKKAEILHPMRPIWKLPIRNSRIYAGIIRCRKSG